MKIVLQLFLAMATRAFWGTREDADFGRLFWATTLGTRLVVAAAGLGPELASKAFVKQSLLEEQLLNPPLLPSEARSVKRCTKSVLGDL